jgi:hypothetical protein
MIDAHTFSKYGNYYVNNKLYNTKREALEAAKGNRNLVQWRFNDETYDRFDWTKDPFPFLNISDLYRLRAQEIRDTNDYVALMVSGGPDSTNMLESFVHNGLKVDEVINVNCYHNIKKVVGTINNADYIYNFKPSLDALSKQFNFNPKITLLDEIDYVQLHWKYMWQRGRDDICWEFGGATSILPRGYMVLYLPHIWQMILQGKKVAVVVGTDKPHARLINGKYAIQFNDIMESNYREMAKEFGFEQFDFWHWFYNAPTTAPLIIKQAHLLKNFVDSHPEPEFYENIENSKTFRRAHYWPSRHGHGHLKYDIFHKLIYPNWTAKVVTPKSPDFIFRPEDTWWLKDLKVKEKSIWESSLKKFVKTHHTNSWQEAGLASLCVAPPRFIE